MLAHWPISDEVNIMTTPGSSTNHPDVVLIGAGIMSATLAVILKELDPSLKPLCRQVRAETAAVLQINDIRQ